MNREFWLDGFNFFHQWESTRHLLRANAGIDIVRALERSLRLLSRHLGGRVKTTVVYMDGGLAKTETGIGGLRVRYCGPGGKADDRLADDASYLGRDARMITAISNDRELKNRLRVLGVSSLGVGEFLSVVEGRSTAGRGRGTKPGRPVRSEDADVLREKCKNLTEWEVEAWLELFGGDEEV